MIHASQSPYLNRHKDSSPDDQCQKGIIVTIPSGGTILIIDPNNFEGFNRGFTGVIVPRPIAFVSSMSSDGYVNLAP